MHPLAPSRDALVGSLLFLSVVPILSPAVGFPGPCTPTCLILIKQAPEGIHGCMERGETVVGQDGAGAPTYRGEMSHLWRVFASPAQPETESPQLTRSAAIQVESLTCIFHEGGPRRSRRFDPIFTVMGQYADSESCRCNLLFRHKDTSERTRSFTKVMT